MSFINQDREWAASALAVYGYLTQPDGIESSWDGNRYTADAKVSDWHNCRENGFCLSVTHYMHKRNVPAHYFLCYEHRNSDQICILHWTEDHARPNPPTIDTLPEGVFKDKWDTTAYFSYDKAYDAAQFIIDKLEAAYTIYGESAEREARTDV